MDNDSLSTTDIITTTTTAPPKWRVGFVQSVYNADDPIQAAGVFFSEVTDRNTLRTMWLLRVTEVSTNRTFDVLLGADGDFIRSNPPIDCTIDDDCTIDE